jgi:hypothetical protein
MARDEARHAGFINAVAQGLRHRRRPGLPAQGEEVHLLPAEVHLRLLTYLSEKIG